MMHSYLIPQDGWKRIMHFSGGRSSAYLLHEIITANRQTPNLRVVFCNTGREREQTLQFVRRCEAEWGWPITWLEYHFDPQRRGGRLDPKHRAVEVDFYTASRDGQPFQELIKASKILPNVAMRKCTAELKINTTDRWCRRVLGWPRHRDLLGIRYDEPRRWKRALMKECRAEYPLMHAGVTETDVLDFWAQNSFNLAIPSSLGNCDLCFLKGRSGLLRVMRAEPDRAAWWIRQENSTAAQFSKRHSYTELLTEAAAGSDQLSLLDDDAGIDCFCGE